MLEYPSVLLPKRTTNSETGAEKSAPVFHLATAALLFTFLTAARLPTAVLTTLLTAALLVLSTTLLSAFLNVLLSIWHFFLASTSQYHRTLFSKGSRYLDRLCDASLRNWDGLDS